MCICAGNIGLREPAVGSQKYLTLILKQDVYNAWWPNWTVQRWLSAGVGVRGRETGDAAGVRDIQVVLTLTYRWAGSVAGEGEEGQVE